jgi:hypothetical protein
MRICAPSSARWTAVPPLRGRSKVVDADGADADARQVGRPVERQVGVVRHELVGVPAARRVGSLEQDPVSPLDPAPAQFRLADRRSLEDLNDAGGAHHRLGREGVHTLCAFRKWLGASTCVPVRTPSARREAVQTSPRSRCIGWEISTAWSTPLPLGTDVGHLPALCERPGHFLRLSQPLSRTGVDATAARPGRVAAIAVVPGCNSSSADGGHVHGDGSAERLWPRLRPGALHRCMIRRDGCSRLVPRRDHTADAASLQALASNGYPSPAAAETDLFGAASQRGPVSIWINTYAWSAGTSRIRASTQALPAQTDML